MPDHTESAMQIIAGFFATLTAASFLAFASFTPIGIFSSSATEVTITTTESTLSDGNFTAVVRSVSRTSSSSSGFTYNNTLLAPNQFPVLPNALVSGGMLVSRFFLSLVYGLLIGIAAMTGPLIFQRLSGQEYSVCERKFWTRSIGLAVVYSAALLVAALGLGLSLVTIGLIVIAFLMIALFSRRYFSVGLGVIGFGFTLGLVLKCGGGTPTLLLPAGIVLISFLVGTLLYASTGRLASEDVDSKNQYLAYRARLGQGSLTLGVALAIGGALTFGAETTSQAVPLATFVGVFFFPFAGVAAIEYYRMARLVRPDDSTDEPILSTDKIRHSCVWVKKFLCSKMCSEPDTDEAENKEE